MTNFLLASLTLRTELSEIRRSQEGRELEVRQGKNPIVREIHISTTAITTTHLIKLDRLLYLLQA